MYEIPVYPTESFEHAQKPDTTGLSVISNFALNSLAEVPGEERPILNFKINGIAIVKRLYKIRVKTIPDIDKGK